MRSVLLCALLLSPTVAMGGDAKSPSDRPRNTAKALPIAERFADRYWEAYLTRYPTTATAIGDYRSIDRLDDLSEAAHKQWEKNLRGLQSELRRAPTGGLSEQDRFTLTLLDRVIADGLLREACLSYLTPLDPLDGPHLRFPLVLVAQPFRNTADFDAYVALLRTFPGQVTDMIDNMRKGIATGFVSPRVVVQRTIPQIKRHIVSQAGQSEFFAPVAKTSAFSESDRRRIMASVIEAIEQDVVPAYLQLLGFVEDVYLPQTRETVGIGSVPHGKQIYGLLAYLSTTVRMAPDEIHALGLSEVERIRVEMTTLKGELGFDGTLPEFIDHMRTDPAQRFTSAAELVGQADRFLQQTKPLLSKLFGRLPRADIVMKPIESFRAASSPVAYYGPCPEDGSRPGYYYINTYKPEERLRFTLEALTYHEAIPGHHLQLALDQENQSLPKFRRYASFTAYAEGWALYAEKLGYEIGGYQDIYQRFGQLTFEMWRACRLVVDTGMHVNGWSRERAIEFMSDNTALAPLDIAAEVDRYITWPGQALAYKIGELSIGQLRRDAEAALKDRFDLRAFHDELLSGGAMPIDMLEQRMRAWIERSTQ